MIIDLRYHIATLVALFLMLGLGILIGTSLIGNDALLRQQEQMATRLEKQLEELRQENMRVQKLCEATESENRNLRKFAQEVLPYVVAGKLKGRQVAVVEVAGKAPVGMIGALKTAGAVVEPVISLLDDYTSPSADLSVAQALGWPTDNQGEVLSRLSQELGTSLATGQTPDFIELLASHGLVRVEGNYKTAVQAVVVVGGGNNEQRLMRVDLPLINALVKDRLTVVGVEESSESGSSTRAYQGQKISTVDNVDRPEGQIALILALAGQPGQYGSKGSNRDILPAYPVGGR
ncbi:copper transporter [Desulfothermobacter acidiphilus]|uniref:copper transporter n=1 Tax=Desulfothermobacter acidiphilus TaxID=1938353 RepID=UPI003F893BB2